MKYLKVALIILISLTILICFLKPKKHKRVFIADFHTMVKQVENSYTSNDIFTDEQDNQNRSIIKNQKKTTASNNKIKNPQQNSNKVPEKVNTQQKSVQNINQPKIEKTVPKKINSAPKIPTRVNKKTGRALTPEEAEIIAWNIWRSNLQNKVMRDTHLRAPIGTVFRFSFTVDKFGNVSNLKVWSDNSDYTPIAVRTIKPAILSYQGQSILNFPPESKRVITNVNGRFTVWYQAGYSSPSDYSDYERVRR